MQVDAEIDRIFTNSGCAISVSLQEHFSSYPDLVAYHSIAVTLGQAGYMRELFDVIDSMRSPPKKKFKTGVLEKWDPRLQPDIVIYNAVSHNW